MTYGSFCSIALGALILAAAPLAVEAQSYRCTGKDGKKYYGSTPPRACLGQPMEQLNRHGTVIRRIDPEAEARERAARRAAEEKREENEAAARERARRQAALLATYTSLKDIEAARQRALDNNAKAMQQIDDNIAEIRKRQAGYAKELEFYKGKTPPAKLAADVQNAETELKYQEQLRATKQKEVQTINARYDEDKRDYAQLAPGR